MLTGPGRLDGRVQSQQIGLPGNGGDVLGHGVELIDEGVQAVDLLQQAIPVFQGSLQGIDHGLKLFLGLAENTAQPAFQ